MEDSISRFTVRTWPKTCTVYPASAMGVQNILNRVKLKAASSALHLLQYVKGRLKTYAYIPDSEW